MAADSDRFALIPPDVSWYERVTQQRIVNDVNRQVELEKWQSQVNECRAALPLIAPLLGLPQQAEEVVCSLCDERSLRDIGSEFGISGSRVAQRRDYALAVAHVKAPRLLMVMAALRDAL